MRASLVVAVIVILSTPFVGAESYRTYLDGPMIWRIEGEASQDCTSFEPECRIRFEPTRRSQQVPPGQARASAVLPEAIALTGALTWSFTGSVAGGWSDADLVATLADGTVLLVSHTEDRNHNGESPNNGLTLHVGATRLADIAAWPALEEQRVTLFFEAGTVRLALAPADGSRPAVVSVPVPLPTTAIEIRALELRATSFGDLPGNPASYWVGDFRASADAALAPALE